MWRFLITSYTFIKKIDFKGFVNFLLIRISHVHLVLSVNLNRFLNKYHDISCDIPLQYICLKKIDLGSFSNILVIWIKIVLLMFLINFDFFSINIMIFGPTSDTSIKYFYISEIISSILHESLTRTSSNLLF